MINLLPPPEKEHIVFQRNKNLVFVLGIIFLTSLVCFGLILFSLRFYVLGEGAARKFLVESAEKKYTGPDFDSFKKVSETYNTLFQRIDSFYATKTYFSDVLQEIFSLPRPLGFYFTSINIEQKPETNNVTVTLLGNSATRDDLIHFKDALEHADHVSNVSFPPSNWVSPNNVSFQCSFDISLPHTHGL